MSTMRRRLGTGPTTRTTSSADAESLRLLPAERIEPDTCLQEHDDGAQLPESRGRRTLGRGTATP
ncbi:MULTISPECIES: hypothetical protein [unclassified Streptomyces]|uniref:hypothetical protein n=1 Tax=unclassified Streptomyces TaxID=2593676 RepID=UPI00339EB1D4